MKNMKNIPFKNLLFVMYKNIYSFNYIKYLWTTYGLNNKYFYSFKKTKEY